jgi:hypothetical protein
MAGQAKHGRATWTWIRLKPLLANVLVFAPRKHDELFAISPDKAGANLPKSSCTQGWLVRKEFQLGAQKPVAPIAPDAIIRGVSGHFICVGALEGTKVSFALFFVPLQLIERQEWHDTLPALAVEDDLVGAAEHSLHGL